MLLPQQAEGIQHGWAEGTRPGQAHLLLNITKFFTVPPSSWPDGPGPPRRTASQSMTASKIVKAIAAWRTTAGPGRVCSCHVCHHQRPAFPRLFAATCRKLQ
jgi:hypothetical protein